MIGICIRWVIKGQYSDSWRYFSGAIIYIFDILRLKEDYWEPKILYFLAITFIIKAIIFCMLMASNIPNILVEYSPEASYC